MRRLLARWLARDTQLVIDTLRRSPHWRVTEAISDTDAPTVVAHVTTAVHVSPRLLWRDQH